MLKKDILLWNIGDRSSETFEPIWQIIKCWHSFWYVTDGWKVYPMYIEPEDHLVCKTYMTRVEVRNALRRKHLNSIQVNGEGENTRLRHYLARLHRAYFVLFQINSSSQIFYSPIIALFEIRYCAIFSLEHYALTNARLFYGI